MCVCTVPDIGTEFEVNFRSQRGLFVNHMLHILKKKCHLLKKFWFFFQNFPIDIIFARFCHLSF